MLAAQVKSKIKTKNNEYSTIEINRNPTTLIIPTQEQKSDSLFVEGQRLQEIIISTENNSSSLSDPLLEQNRQFNNYLIKSCGKRFYTTGKLNSNRMFAIGLIATILAILFICAIRPIAASASPLTTEELKFLCPDERDFCHEHSKQGFCYGKSIKAKLLAKQCKCSCANAHHRRIQNCCRTVGDHDMRFCLPLCGYNTTASDLGSGLGLKCITQLTIWTYCAAGVPSECASFCRGDVPTCDMSSIFSYQPCLKNLDKILECQMEDLAPEPHFDKKWRPVCDWQN
uniref:DB domain-containing protein n=1 Tax=Meloidogyne hapla TaxID=6305 RepID=A0A1I8BNC2_MELHA